MTAPPCVLCDEPTSVRTIGAMILTGDVAAPDASVLCRRCAALPSEDQRRRRDAAMARMLRVATVAATARLDAALRKR